MSRHAALYISAHGWAAAHRKGTAMQGAHGGLAASDWDGVAERMRESFGRQRVNVVLSALHCRFQVLPWLSSCATGKAIREHVWASFAESGMSVTEASHHVEVEWPRYGCPIVAVAYPRESIASITSSFSKYDMRVVSVESSIGPMLGRYRDSLDEEPALLAYAEDDGITGLTIERARLVWIETVGAGADGLDRVHPWAARQRYAFGGDNHLYWVASAPAPEGLAGCHLLSFDDDAIVSPGHAIAGLAS